VGAAFDSVSDLGRAVNRVGADRAIRTVMIGGHLRFGPPAKLRVLSTSGGRLAILRAGGQSITANRGHFAAIMTQRS
jgi:hypothetical protein